MNTALFVCVLVDVIFLRLSALEEIKCDLTEQRIGENVLLLFCVGCDLLAELIELGLEQVCGAAGYLGAVAEYLLLEIEVDGCGRSAVLTCDETCELLRYHLIAQVSTAELLRYQLKALAAENVEHRLRTDHLRRRGNERGITRICADARNLAEHLGEQLALTCVLKLRNKV